MYNLDDTIAAIATAPGGALRGVVRLSGSRALEHVSDYFQSDEGAIALAELKTAQTICGRLIIEPFAAAIPCQLYVWPNNRSYTRETVVEIHTIGSPPILDAILDVVCCCGARLAEPGEFTMRSFLAGRLDLTQAEAVLGVIDAEGQRQLDSALDQLAGGLSRPLASLREELLDLLAQLEAGLDFVEEDIEFITAEQLVAQLTQATDQVDAIADQIASRDIQAAGGRVALIGWPNVGKSSLFNALVGEGRAIVSPIAGTTRDYLTATLSLDQLQVELIDTAGLETVVKSNDSQDATSIATSITTMAQSMTDRWQRQASLLVLCLDASRELNAWERDQLDRSQQIVVFTKSDLMATDDANDVATGPLANAPLASALLTSSQSGKGVEALREQIAQAISDATDSESSVVAATAIRCRESLRLAATSLGHALQAAADQLGEELIAAEVRTALNELGKVAGAVYTDDILDRIFSRFCIGK